MDVRHILAACDVMHDTLRNESARHGHITIEIGLDEFEHMFYYFESLNLKRVNRLGRQWNEPEMLEYKGVFRFKAVPLRELSERYFR